MWRVRGDVPISVEATASLIECQLAARGEHSENELRHLLSMTLIRMVNGIKHPYFLIRRHLKIVI